ncbi:unnamed protein product [Caenorhabditis bovis]|uniref:Inheritance of peroxisomes protein 1 n=1 Tax=Caenorhabditis bovis TaxID=2654633 RepID=A0A8S1F5Y6_9PELO|nr:unnamed protein product [Caenorhabditis bovis]
MKETTTNQCGIPLKSDSLDSQEADLVFSIPHGVQLFTIDGDKTTAPTDPTSLQLLKLNSEFDDEDQKVCAFIQVGPWVYPLMKEKTPILKNEFGAYVMPNPTPDRPNMMAAILVSEEVDDELKQDLQNYLKEFANLRIQDESSNEFNEDEKVRLSRKISQFFITKGQKIASGVENRLTEAANKVQNKGEAYRSNAEPAEQPTQVSPIVKEGVVYMHKGTKTVAKFTNFILEKVGDVANAIGDKLAAGVQKTYKDGKPPQLVADTIEILGGGLTGLGMVFMALEHNGKVLGRSIVNETVESVKLKYGDEASETTKHALSSASH